MPGRPERFEGRGGFYSHLPNEGCLGDGITDYYLIRIMPEIAPLKKAISQQV